SIAFVYKAGDHFYYLGHFLGCSGIIICRGYIKCMRSAGLPIEVLIEYVGLVQQGGQTIEARKEILIEQREQLVARMEEMQKTLDVLNR
ncbi:HTH-type transcriptional regulator AdhR, partial [Dehalococcoides mccartyi]